MHEIRFKTVDELANKMYSLANSFTDESIVFIGLQNSALKLFQSLMKLDIAPAFIHFEDEKTSHYGREYIVTLYEGNVYFEELYNSDSDKYKIFTDDAVFIHEDCSSLLINSRYIETHIDEIDGDDCDIEFN